MTVDILVPKDFWVYIGILWDSRFCECSRNIVHVRGNKLLQVPTGRQSERRHPDLAQDIDVRTVKWAFFATSQGLWYA